MTVADLIRELQRHKPHKDVRVRCASIYNVCPHCADEKAGPYEILLNDDDATEADDVRDEGPWIQIVGR